MQVFKAKAAIFDSIWGEWTNVTVPQTVCVISLDGTLPPSSLTRQDEGWFVSEEFWDFVPKNRIFGQEVLICDRNGGMYVPRSKGETRQKLVKKFLEEK